MLRRFCSMAERAGSRYAGRATGIPRATHTPLARSCVVGADTLKCAYELTRHMSSTSKKKLRVYTRTGDKGKSSLYTGERRRKDDAVFSALGDTDELNSALGVAREYCLVPELAVLEGQLQQLQSRLLDAGSAIATPASSASADALTRASFGEEHATILEGWIDAMDDELPALRNFVLPSGGLAAAQLHMARTICRRAERSVSALVLDGEVQPATGIFLNRLSDFLFTAARFAAMKQGREETVYQKAK